MNGGDGFSILIIVWKLCKIVKVGKKLKKKISFGRVKPIFARANHLSRQQVNLKSNCLSWWSKLKSLSHPLFLFSEEENFKAVHEVINVFCGRILN